jgi:hypothetical protein
VEVELHAFFTSALDGGEWSASRPDRFTSLGKSPWHPLDRRLRGLQNRFGRGGEEKNSQSLPRLEYLYKFHNGYFLLWRRLHKKENKVGNILYEVKTEL